MSAQQALRRFGCKMKVAAERDLPLAAILSPLWPKEERARGFFARRKVKGGRCRGVPSVMGCSVLSQKNLSEKGWPSPPRGHSSSGEDESKGRVERHSLGLQIAHRKESQHHSHADGELLCPLPGSPPESPAAGTTHHQRVSEYDALPPPVLDHRLSEPQRR